MWHRTILYWADQRVHVCCRGDKGEGGGFNLEDGKAFFTSMYVELANPRTQFEVKYTLQYWLVKLGIEKSASDTTGVQREWYSWGGV